MKTRFLPGLALLLVPMLALFWGCEVSEENPDTQTTPDVAPDIPSDVPTDTGDVGDTNDLTDTMDTNDASDAGDQSDTQPDAPPPTCTDQAQNQDETDVDCGGTQCQPCTPGMGCMAPSDCDSEVCGGTTCASPMCGDGVTNGSEACDDANGDDTDACLSNCQLAMCGDGIVQVGVEDCDDGTLVRNIGDATDLDGPTGVGFDPDGNLVVANSTRNNLVRFDRTTGAYIGEVVAPGAGGLASPMRFVFGPDGNWYVTSRTTGQVLRYSGQRNYDLLPDACRMDCALPTCGDNVRDTGEACDGTDLGGAETCTDIGATSGTLSCDSSCEYTGCTF